MSPPPKAALAAFALLSAACGDEGVAPVSFEATARVSASAEIDVGEARVVLDEARLAFGPAYFCAAASGSATLCDAAVVELTRVLEVDLLSAGPQPLGRVRGFEGEVRSASFDYGIHFFLTQSSPRASAAAPGGHSAVFSGTVETPSGERPFVAEVDVVPQFSGQRAVTSAAVSAVVGEGTQELEVAFDPASWLSRVDWEGLAAEGEGPIVIEPGSKAHDAIVIAMVTRPPGFVFR